uniref:C2H2-type domain-containing protein n=1 Tax=Amphimedon queenslandica TaxID=400682 RepID=A0A1X7T9R9_AMPQE
MMFRCHQRGCSFVCLSINDYLRHLRVVNHDNFCCFCCYEGCTAGEFHTVAAFKSHIYRTHYDRSEDNPELIQASSSTDIAISTVNHPVTAINDETQDAIVNPDLEADINRLKGIDVVEQKRSSALFLLRLKEIHHIPQVAVDSVVHGSQELFQQTVQRLKAGVRLKLAEAGIEESLSQEINSVFEDLMDPYTGLETEYLQNAYIRETFKIPVS